MSLVVSTRKVFFFPREIMDLIYEYNPEHRHTMKRVMHEYMIRFHFPKWYYVCDQLLWHVNCENCLSPKPYNQLQLPYCSSKCRKKASDYVEELV
jgi:hypothetical protein